MKIVENQRSKDDKQTNKLLNKINIDLAVVKVDRADLPFWLAFSTSSYHVATDRLEKNITLHDLEIAFFSDLQEDVEIYIEADDNSLCSFEFSFLDIVLLHDNLDLFTDSLFSSEGGEWIDISQRYLHVFGPFIESDKCLYQDTLNYLHEKVGLVV